MEDLLNAVPEFDVFLIDPNYKQKIEKVNPPLSVEEFEKEMKSDSQYKKYSYNYVQKEAELPLHSIKANENKLKISFQEILESIIRGIQKYSTLQNFDHINSMDKQKKESELRMKTNPWKDDQSKVDKVEN